MRCFVLDRPLSCIYIVLLLSHRNNPPQIDRHVAPLRLVFLHELKIEVLLFGDDTLTEMQNLQIFKSVQLYIKRTKRFTHL